MTQQSQKHTEKSLQEMFERNPRELDALAHELMFGEHPMWIVFDITDTSSSRNGVFNEPYVFGKADAHGYFNRTQVPQYSMSLNDVAKLEAELIERGKLWYYGHQFAALAAGMVTVNDDGDGRFDESFNYYQLARLITVDARQRTIATILAIANSAGI